MQRLAPPPAHLEQHRSDLTHYCRRLLRDADDAEDAAQETLVRAWQSLDRFEGRASMRTWLYTIATNVCYDVLRTRRRQPRTVVLPSVDPGRTAAEPPLDDPADRAVERESVRLAFAAAAQLLPPRQRAVVVLHDVFRWPANEVAELLDTTVPSVTSALQRARVTLAAREPTPVGALAGADGPAARSARQADAFVHREVGRLVSLLREDMGVPIAAAL